MAVEQSQINTMRRRYADDLFSRDDLRSSTWREAFACVPRHAFVPRVFWWDDRKSDHHSAIIESDSDRWLGLVYSDNVLVIEPGKPGASPVSSSSQPSMMLAFLEGLEVKDGNSVLEIGTGSGYNAALLCERLGSDRVTTIDVVPHLVEAARERLRETGYTPTVEIADGRRGFPRKAPYDRIIATCSVSRIPQGWVDQLRDDGIIVAPLRGGCFEAGIVALKKQPDGSASGRLLRELAWFMPMTQDPTPADRDNLETLAAEGMGERRLCIVPAYLTTPSGQTFFAAALLRMETPGMEWFWMPDPAVAMPDGSWARVTLDKPPVVEQGGPRRLWDIVERSYDLFLSLVEPGSDRYGITVRPDGEQWAWLDSPDSGHTWEI